MYCKVFNRKLKTCPPEQKYEGEEEGPEVVVLVDGTFAVFFEPDVPKELVQKQHNKHVNAQLSVQPFKVTLHQC